MNSEGKKTANPLLDVNDILDEDEIEGVLSTFNEETETKDEEENELEEENEGTTEETESPEVQPEATLVQVSVRIPRVLRTRAKIVAARHQITLSTMIIRGLEMVLEQLKVPPRK